MTTPRPHAHAEASIPGGTTEMMGASGDDTGSLERDSEAGTDAYQPSRSTAMRIRLTFITPLLGAAAVAAAIAAAPTEAAESGRFSQ